MKISNIEIAGKEYPMCFSVNAAKEITEKFGGLENLPDEMSGEDLNKTFDIVINLVSLLLKEGAEYNKIIENSEVRTFTDEELVHIFGISDLFTLKEKIFDTISDGSEREVEIDTDIKNVETTQDN